MKLIITIDTEEDNWGHYCSTGQTLTNIDRIPQLQSLFDTYNIKPTYLITYPVATDDKSIKLFVEIEKSGRCEIGTHCHPWNTPPFDEELNERNSMLCNLHPDLQYDKIHHLHNTIITNLGVEPTSFRSGRWGYNQGVAESLLKLGYKVDSSITSYTDWRDYHGSDFSDVSPRPFRFSCKDSFRETTDGQFNRNAGNSRLPSEELRDPEFIDEKTQKGTVQPVQIIGILQKCIFLTKSGCHRRCLTAMK